MSRRIRASALAAFLLAVGSRSVADGAYRNFQAAIYASVNSTRAFEDPGVLAQQFSRVAGQLRFDKVYIETYRSGVFADEASLERTKQFFTDHGIAIAGGIAFSAPEHGGHGGQFSTLDYENPHDREECRHAVELTARHFDEIILDDFFFYSSKSDADIAAKGRRSWTQYRLERMREVANELVLKPARAVNPKVKVIIKYPNWYEHFQGLGYDLDSEAKAFDFIYTGTETRDPEITDQLLQQYESYEVFRFFDNVRPHGGNRGGWVDTYDTRYVDRFPEQIWDTMFAKAPEITLFNWSAMASADALQPGERQAWSSLKTSFDWDDMMRSSGVDSPGWARAAGYALEQVDQVIGRLGKPLGIAAYKPYQSSGEDYLHNYLGNIGLPIELTPQFPSDAPLVLLTESAGQDPSIVAKIRQQLKLGKSVVVTSGLLQALQGRGLRDIAEVEYTGRKIAVHDFVGAYGAGRGVSLNEPGRASRGLLFPEIRFYTNDAWPLIRGVAGARGVPLLLMDRYSRGALYILNIPDNPGDLYELPQPLLKVLRSYLQVDMPVRLDAPDHVSLFTYDNGTFIVQSFRAEPVSVNVSLAGVRAQILDLMSSELIAAELPKPTPPAARVDAPVRTEFRVELAPHSYRVFSMQ